MFVVSVRHLFSVERITGDRLFLTCGRARPSPSLPPSLPPFPLHLHFLRCVNPQDDQATPPEAVTTVVTTFMTTVVTTFMTKVTNVVTNHPSVRLDTSTVSIHRDTWTPRSVLLDTSQCPPPGHLVTLEPPPRSPPLRLLGALTADAVAAP